MKVNSQALFLPHHCCPSALINVMEDVKTIKNVKKDVLGLKCGAISSFVSNVLYVKSVYEQWEFALKVNLMTSYDIYNDISLSAVTENFYHRDLWLFLLWLYLDKTAGCAGFLALGFPRHPWFLKPFCMNVCENGWSWSVVLFFLPKNSKLLWAFQTLAGRFNFKQLKLFQSR